MKLEKWRDIKDYPNYEISNNGRVKSIARKTPSKNNILISRKELILKGYVCNKGYHIVCLYDVNKKMKAFRVHRLVGQVFIENTYNKKQINHKDGNKLNNNVNNLEWCTNQENINHAIKNGLINQELRKENMRKLGKSKKALNKRWGTL